MAVYARGLDIFASRTTLKRTADKNVDTLNMRPPDYG